MIEPIRIWRMAGGDGTRRGVADATLASEIKQVDVLKAKGAVTASPVFTENKTVHIADRAGFIQAFSPDESLLWREKLNAGVDATPAIDKAGKTICVATLDGHFAFFDAKRGERTSSGGYSVHDARILADLLYTEEPERFITSVWGEWVFFALSPKENQPDREWNAGWNPRAPMAALPGGPAYGIRVESERESKGTRLFSIDVETGKEGTVRFFPAGKETPSRLTSFASPVLTQEIIYAIINGAYDSALFAIDRNTHEEMWSCDLPCTVSTTPALTLDRCVIIAGMDGRVYAIDENGRSRFTYSSNCEYLLSSPVCDKEGRVVIGDPMGRIHIIEPDGEGRVVFEAPRSIEGRPAFSPEGRLFVPCTDGGVHVLK